MREMEIDLIQAQKISSISSTRILELERDAKGLGVRLAELQTLLDESIKIDMAKNVQIELGNSSEYMLFDLERDPYQKDNLAKKNPEKLKFMISNFDKIKKY